MWKVRQHCVGNRWRTEMLFSLLAYLLFVFVFLMYSSVRSRMASRPALRSHPNRSMLSQSGSRCSLCG